MPVWVRIESFCDCICCSHYSGTHETSWHRVGEVQRKELAEWAKANPKAAPQMQMDDPSHISDATFANICGLQTARKRVLTFLGETAKKERLQGFERIQAVVLEARPFSAEEDLMTPSFKLKRHKLQAKYQKALDDMYAQLKAQARP
jgi:long-subunit acyl-CoA synthetase (AMP-forming)